MVPRSGAVCSCSHAPSRPRHSGSFVDQRRTSLHTTKEIFNIRSPCCAPLATWISLVTARRACPPDGPLSADAADGDGTGTSVVLDAKRRNASRVRRTAPRNHRRQSAPQGLRAVPKGIPRRQFQRRPKDTSALSLVWNGPERTVTQASILARSPLDES